MLLILMNANSQFDDGHKIMSRSFFVDFKFGIYAFKTDNSVVLDRIFSFKFDIFTFILDILFKTESLKA